MVVTLLLGIASIAEDPCWVHEKVNGIPVIRYIGDRACVEFQPPRTFEGIFIDGFEGQIYYDGATSLAQIKGRTDGVWFSVDDKTRFDASFESPRFRGAAYVVTFRGRAAKDMHRKPLEGYGHMGMSPGVVLVDEVVKVRLLEP